MVTSAGMISIRKERNPEITIRSMVKERTLHKEHPAKVNVTSVEKEVTTGMSVDPKPKL